MINLRKCIACACVQFAWCTENFNTFLRCIEYGLTMLECIIYSVRTNIKGLGSLVLDISLRQCIVYHSNKQNTLDPTSEPNQFCQSIQSIINMIASEVSAYSNSVYKKTEGKKVTVPKFVPAHPAVRIAIMLPTYYRNIRTQYHRL